MSSRPRFQSPFKSESSFIPASPSSTSNTETITAPGAPKRPLRSNDYKYDTDKMTNPNVRRRLFHESSPSNQS